MAETKATRKTITSVQAKKSNVYFIVSTVIAWLWLFDLEIWIKSNPVILDNPLLKAGFGPVIKTQKLH